MAKKLEAAVRLELKGAIARIAYLLFEIDTRMKPSLSDRINELREGECTENNVREVYEKYIDEVAEEYVKRMEEDPLPTSPLQGEE